MSLRELLEKFAERVQRYEEDGRIGEAENFQEIINQATKEVEKGMLSEEEIMEIIKSDELDDCYKYEPIKYKYRKRLAHALYTSQKERTER